MEEQAKLGRLLKQHMIDHIAGRLQNTTSLFVTECGKLSNKQLEDLKKRLKKISSNYMVVKNSMCKRALEKIGLEKMQEFINGTCAVTFGTEDPIITSKILVGFTKENEKFQLKGAYIDGEVVSVDTIKKLATIPPREVLLARFVSSINSPISGMAGVLSGVIRKLVHALNAIKDKREGGK